MPTDAPSVSHHDVLIAGGGPAGRGGAPQGGSPATASAGRSAPAADPWAGSASDDPPF